MEKKKPQQRNAAVTRQKILKAARQEFAKKGFDGARVDSIAAKAKVNKNMLYHYFGGKDELFIAVLEETYRAFRDSEAVLQLQDMPANDAIIALVDFTWRYYLAHPDFIRMLNAENQVEARHLKKSSFTKEINERYINSMKELLLRGQQEGNVRADLNPMQVQINIAALGFFYLINRYTLSTVYEYDLMSDRALEERLSVMKDTISRWINPQSPS